MGILFMALMLVPALAAAYVYEKLILKKPWEPKSHPTDAELSHERQRRKEAEEALKELSVAAQAAYDLLDRRCFESLTEGAMLELRNLGLCHVIPLLYNALQHPAVQRVLADRAEK